MKEGRKEGRKEMFYLMTHSTHFYLWFYGIGHMVKDHSVREETCCCCYMGYSLSLAASDLLLNVLFNDAFNTFLFTVIWHRTYGKYLLSQKRHRLFNMDT